MPDVPSTLAEALAAVGASGPSVARRPVLTGHDATLITLATLGPDGAPTWHGLWIDAAGIHPVGPRAPSNVLTDGHRLAPETSLLLDLVLAASRSSMEWLETLGSRLDDLESRPDPAPLPALAELLHSLAASRKHTGRLGFLVAELEGPLGARFPDLAAQLPTLRAEVTHLEGVSAGLAQSVRDLVAIRNAMEGNRLAESANRLGTVSNRIAALANTSNLRMLGVAYIALVLALISAVVLIPNTAATILGVPGAAWVPGPWIVVILVVLAVVPIVVVFSRPWVWRTLRALPASEIRSEEGLADLPEVPPQNVEADASLLRQAP